MEEPIYKPRRTQADPEAEELETRLSYLFSDALLIQRKKLKLKPVQAARLLGIQYLQYYRLEKKERVISFKLIAKYCTILGIQISFKFTTKTDEK